MKNRRRLNTVLAGTLLCAAWLSPQSAHSHCDTMNGPVIQAAQAALDRKDVTPVLKWIKPDDEAEIKAAFAKTLAVRKQSPEARELADRFFFETLVRVHRSGEGAPFTGLKPAATELEPAVEAADKALESGSVEAAVKLVTDDAATGIRKRFALVREKKGHAGDSVEAGREFVAAYVDYIHYVEGLHEAAQGAGANRAETHEATSAKGTRQETVSHHSR